MSASGGWWESLRHSGLLLGPAETRRLETELPVMSMGEAEGSQLRRDLNRFAAGELERGPFVARILETVCGLGGAHGEWKRGSAVEAAWSRQLISGESRRPQQLWTGATGGRLPVFVEASRSSLGVGKSRKFLSDVVQWLRLARQPVALATNGCQWRLLVAGMDYEASCEWDTELWFAEGAPGPQLEALRLLLQPGLYRPQPSGQLRLEELVNDARKGQAELSAILGERVREAVELLVRAHGDALKEAELGAHGAEIYRAAVRVVMRMVVILFAESRELLPLANPHYFAAYSLRGLMESLQKQAARRTGLLEHRYAAWPRILALFRLIYEGSHHEALPVPDYGGELFEPGDAGAAEADRRALAVLETAAFQSRYFDRVTDRVVWQMLALLTRTQVRIRQGRGSTRVSMPVDFSALSSEYIGILYEGLLDYELRTAPEGDPILFLAVGNEPALPLSRLEEMGDRQIKELLATLKEEGDSGPEEDDLDEPDGADASPADEETPGETPDDEAETASEEAVEEAGPETGGETVEATRQRALQWALRVVELAKLVRKPRGNSPEKAMVYRKKVEAMARQLLRRIVLPGEWYLVRWGGTRKGSGTFYTRPQLAVPTVQRTLRPMACEQDGDGRWRPRPPEDILRLKLCDPSCGSGSFILAGLRYLTETLYESLFVHERLQDETDRTMVRLLGGRGEDAAERLADERIPCRMDDEHFEGRVKAVLRRHLVERCIYGVDIDPLAVELCRLSLWIETMDRSLPFSFLDHKIRCGNSLVGAWFDQFAHYPAMAWKNREGGDKAHSNGVHFGKGDLTEAIKQWTKDTLTPDLADFLGGATLFREDLQAQSLATHAEAQAAFAALHDIPIRNSRERARRFHELRQSPAYRQLKDAFDRWCACWFWPGDRLEVAPLPDSFARPPDATTELARQIAAEKRFFHWELEFPDVFTGPESGFDALLGNPPWEIAKPNSKEFFSNHDPLYRAYGKQEALRKQSEYFQRPEVERAWIDYLADLKAQGNYLRCAANPFGDPAASDRSTDKFSIARGKRNKEIHAEWRAARARSRGYTDPRHPFLHQGSADINLYKLFLEVGHALLRDGGRLGMIVPSGIYSDHGTGALRDLFINHCAWEWLFGFENRDKLFDIDSRFKFNPVIVQKGGRTAAIQTAFMRRRLADWENAEELAIPYPREQVEQFSPWSKALLEIQSEKDLAILRKIYANSVLLGDTSEKGWGIRYATEFHMTNDSRLFPPREKWEADGYQPDEYSRWLKGPWRPVAELWRELGVVPLPEGETRCAQPPYDRIPLPRADIPEGILLNREATQWIHEDNIEDTALPLYQGKMIWRFDFSHSSHVNGSDWEELAFPKNIIQPRYLLGIKSCQTTNPCKVLMRDVSSPTNKCTFISAITPYYPAGHKTPALSTKFESPDFELVLCSLLNSHLFDHVLRLRFAISGGGGSIIWAMLSELPLLGVSSLSSIRNCLVKLSAGLSFFGGVFASGKLRLKPILEACVFKTAVTDYERQRLASAINAIVFSKFGLEEAEAKWILRECDFPVNVTNERKLSRNFFPKSFWRVDKEKPPELRQTVLTLVAFHDLEQKVAECGGDREAGIAAFCEQNDGEGWRIPETLRLADYGLGHDERAKEPQPVASRLGPRFYDWQLAQSVEESWRECALHARNLLGEAGYRQLLSDIEAEKRGETPAREHKVAEEEGTYAKKKKETDNQLRMEF